MFKLFNRPSPAPDLLTSKLFNEKTFYPAFVSDLSRCMNEVIIECPFITSNRMRVLLPTLQKLIRRGVSITINTRHPLEHEEPFGDQAADAIAALQSMGVQVLFTGKHHRKLVIIDQRVLYEGSLNVLSQNDSSEMMRRIQSEELSKQMIRFVGLHKFIG